MVSFDQPLMPGVFLRRFKRFLADIELADGSVTTVHCPNSGSMLGCLGERWPVLLSSSDRSTRRYPFTWEMVHNGRCWIGIDTHLANLVATEGITTGVIEELQGYRSLRREVPYGSSSRIDILLEGKSATCYVEVKNVTLIDDAGHYAFPDAVTRRGLKHLGELQDAVAAGHRGVMLYVIQRSDGSGFAPAASIDPEYARALRKAAAVGVELLAYRARVEPDGVELCEPVPVLLPDQ